MEIIDKKEFWQWAHSDFLSNAQRGILAEYIVGKALNCLSEKRIEWDAHDLVTYEGIRVEVKSAAYIQSWNQKKLSNIRFDIGRKQSWFAKTNTFNDKRERTANVYVFCLLAEKDRQQVDPLNLTQWIFLVATSQTIDNKLSNQKSVGLSTLEKIGARHVGFEELAQEIKCVNRH